MQIILITLENAHIFEVFVQDYESEFSAITKKEPEADWKNPNHRFYQFVERKPVGFAIFDLFRRFWEVRQIPKAANAIAFWRAIPKVSIPMGAI